MGFLSNFLCVFFSFLFLPHWSIHLYLSFKSLPDTCAVFCSFHWTSVVLHYMSGVYGHGSELVSKSVTWWSVRKKSTILDLWHAEQKNTLSNTNFMKICHLFAKQLTIMYDQEDITLHHVTKFSLSKTRQSLKIWGEKRVIW